jgi:hypothetical protein
MLELLERQERLTVNQWKLIFVAILGGALGSLAFFWTVSRWALPALRGI